jgi:hypothetical protein
MHHDFQNWALALFLSLSPSFPFSQLPFAELSDCERLVLTYLSDIADETPELRWKVGPEQHCEVVVETVPNTWEALLGEFDEDRVTLIVSGQARCAADCYPTVSGRHFNS